MPRTMPGKGRHVCYDADGELCMTVVDPVTRKLLIPTRFIFDTRAQQRGTLPSLCQLFLSGRCRQGQGCYQVHADWEAVQRLRAQVDSLPCCCPCHGDKDHLGLTGNTLLHDYIGAAAQPHHPTPHGTHANGNSTSNASGEASEAVAQAAAESTVSGRDVVVHIPGCTSFEGGYVPLDRISYTVGLRRILEEQQVLLAPPDAHVSLLNAETGFAEDKIVADAVGSTVCRLHAMDRCRYAEECKFLHLCKELTMADPQLTTSVSAAAAGADCAGAMPNGSFDASITSAGISATTAMNASTSSAERRGKGTHSASMSGPRQSVFTSISIQQQQQQQQQQQHSQPSQHQQSSSGMMGSGGSFAGRPLLVPQREEPNGMAGGMGGGAMGMPQGSGGAPFLSRSLPPYNAPMAVPMVPSSAVAQPVEAYMGPVVVMAASASSFSGYNSYNSQPVMSNAPVQNNGRIRVALSLPAMNSFPNVNSAAALGTSNSSDKTTSPPAEDGLAGGQGGNAQSLHSNSGMSRSLTQGYGASSSATRWQHNPYGHSLPRCDMPGGGSYGNGSCTNLNASSSNLLAPMAR